MVLRTPYNYFIHRYDQKSKDYVLPLSDIWEMRPGGATRYRYLHNTLTLQVSDSIKTFVFHCFSLIFNDFH